MKHYESGDLTESEFTHKYELDINRGTDLLEIGWFCGFLVNIY